MIPTRLRVAFTVAFLAATSALASPADPPPNGGCACATAPTQLLEQVDHIFIGDLVEVKGGGEDVGTAVIRVRESLKGDLHGLVEVRDALTTQCSWSVFEMAAPGRYVIFANLDEGELVTPAFCPQTQPLSGWQDRLAPFRAYARAHRTGPATAKASPTASGGLKPASPKAGS
ncbi:MAG: hypothetical protein ABIU38_09450 [Vicinamibacteraceae bacterium]